MCVDHLPWEPMFTLTQIGASCGWANDSQHLLLEHFDAICSSPSQIYHSALPFSPSSSWVRKCYSADLLGEVKVVRGLPAKWGTCFRTVPFSHGAFGLAHWKDTIAVGLDSGDIIILDGATGSQAAIFSGHSDYVRSLAFSADGTSLVSGSDDKTIKLWDVQTGGVVKTFNGHTAWVCSVSISADHATIASESHDNTICLWDIQTGGCHHIIEQGEQVRYVGFSPTDTQHLISVSGNGKVQQWDIDGPNINFSYYGDCVVFSSDGTQFLYAKDQRLWFKTPILGQL